MAIKRKTTTAIVAGVTAAAMLLGGTFAWTSISQQARNEAIVDINPGGRLHDDFNGTNKDVYVENFGDEKTGVPIYARIRLYEYMEIGQQAGDKITTDGKKALSLIEDDTINDHDNWEVYKYDTESVFTKYWDWKLGNDDETTLPYYMPTFNKNKDSLAADINGTYEGTVDGDRVHYDDYTPYEQNDTKTDTEVYDHDSNTNEEAEGVTEGGVPAYSTNNPDAPIDDAHVYLNEAQTHTAEQISTTSTVMSMEEWIAAGSQPGPYWVFDTDGWAYWAQAIEPGDTTGLLLDSITLKRVPDDSWYYGINVVGQFATAGDLSAFTMDGEEATDNALKLLASISDMVTFTLDGADMIKPGGSATYTTTLKYAGVEPTTAPTITWSLEGADGINVSVDNGVVSVGSDVLVDTTFTVVAEVSADAAAAAMLTADTETEDTTDTTTEDTTDTTTEDTTDTTTEDTTDTETEETTNTDAVTDSETTAGTDTPATPEDTTDSKIIAKKTVTVGLTTTELTLTRGTQYIPAYAEDFPQIYKMTFDGAGSETISVTLAQASGAEFSDYTYDAATQLLTIDSFPEGGLYFMFERTDGVIESPYQCYFVEPVELTVVDSNGVFVSLLNEDSDNTFYYIKFADEDGNPVEQTDVQLSGEYNGTVTYDPETNLLFVSDPNQMISLTSKNAEGNLMGTMTITEPHMEKFSAFDVVFNESNVYTATVLYEGHSSYAFDNTDAQGYDTTTTLKIADGSALPKGVSIALLSDETATLSVLNVLDSFDPTANPSISLIATDENGSSYPLAVEFVDTLIKKAAVTGPNDETDAVNITAAGNYRFTADVELYDGYLTDSVVWSVVSADGSTEGFSIGSDSGSLNITDAANGKTLTVKADIKIAANGNNRVLDVVYSDEITVTVNFATAE